MTCRIHDTCPTCTAEREARDAAYNDLLAALGADRNALRAERDAAIAERDKAITERDAMRACDAAIAERDAAIAERDNHAAALIRNNAAYDRQCAWHDGYREAVRDLRDND